MRVFWHHRILIAVFLFQSNTQSLSDYVATSAISPIFLLGLLTPTTFLKALFCRPESADISLPRPLGYPFTKGSSFPRPFVPLLLFTLAFSACRRSPPTMVLYSSLNVPPSDLERLLRNFSGMSSAGVH